MKYFTDTLAFSISKTKMDTTPADRKTEQIIYIINSTASYLSCGIILIKSCLISLVA